MIQFHKGALFNVTHHSLLPSLVFGAQVQSTEALNVTAIVSATVRTTVPLQMNWTFVALSVLMLAIMQSVYCLRQDRVESSLSNVTMDLIQRTYAAVCTTSLESLGYVTNVTQRAKKVERCCGAVVVYCRDGAKWDGNAHSHHARRD